MNKREWLKDNDTLLVWLGGMSISIFISLILVLFTGESRILLFGLLGAFAWNLLIMGISS